MRGTWTYGNHKVTENTSALLWVTDVAEIALWKKMIIKKRPLNHELFFNYLVKFIFFLVSFSKARLTALNDSWKLRFALTQVLDHNSDCGDKPKTANIKDPLIWLVRK